MRIILFLISMNFVFAQDYSNLTKSKYKKLKMSQKSEIFSAYDEYLEIVDADDYFKNLSKEELSALERRFNKISNDVTTVWWDTVLEGPYSLLNSQVNFRADEVFLLDGKFFGVSASVSADAIMIEFGDDIDCKYNEDSDSYEGLECSEFHGEISEYVVIDFTFDLIDNDSYADFDH